MGMIFKLLLLTGASLFLGVNGYKVNFYQCAPVGWNSPTIDVSILEQNLQKIENLVQPLNATSDDFMYLFPEFMLSTIRVINDREGAKIVAQRVPEPNLGPSPCVANSQNPDDLVVRRLSCLARVKYVFVAAGLLEKEPCQVGINGCRADGLKIYSTTVVFDKDGYLVAKYRKYHLIDEPALDSADSITTSTFIVNAGTVLGILTGHDLLFAEPTNSYISQNIGNFIITSAWKNRYPFDFSISAQMGWYVRHSTNKAVAVASYLDPEMGYTGNGYYHGTGNFGLHYQSVPGSCSPLLLAPGLRHETNQEFSDDEKGQRAIVAEGIDFSNYIAVNVPLYDTVNRIGVCSGTEFCCSLTYKAENVVPDTHFQLVAFEGNRYASDGTVLFPEQTCGLVACSGWDRSTCGASKNETLYAKEVRFLNLTLVGSFSTDRVIVNTIDGEYNHEKWFYPLSDPRQTNFRLTTNGDRYDAEISNIQPISIKMFGLTSTDYNV